MGKFFCKYVIAPVGIASLPLIILLSFSLVNAQNPEPPHTHELMHSEFAWLLAKPDPPEPDDDPEDTADPFGSGFLTDTYAIHLPVIQMGDEASDERTNDDPVGDNDGDGLTNGTEANLGTNPNAVDSDCDYVSDFAEVVDANAPADGDSDGLIDALESRLSDSNGNGTNDQEDGIIASIGSEDSTAAFQINCAKFSPFAIAANGNDVSTLEARMVGTARAEQVMVDLAVFSTFPMLDGAQLAFGDEFALFDDGTNGDKMAGDGIWSRNGFSSLQGNLSLSRSYEFKVRYLKTVTAGITTTVDLAVNANSTFAQASLFILNPEAVGAPTVVSPTLQHLPNVVNVADVSLALALKANGGVSTEMTQNFYTRYDDDYDFLFFFPDAYAVGAPYGSHRSVQNNIVNIGKSSFDTTSGYGSNGRLLGTMFMNLGGGPTLHELLHQWGVSGLSDLGFNQCIDSAHWGYTGHGEGQLGGFDPTTLVDNGNGTYTVASFGTFANGGDSVPYTPLELYIAGFAPPENVPAVTLPINVNCDSVDRSVPGQITFAADGLQSVTIDTIANHLGGARSPDYTASQKNFKAAFTVLSEQPLTATEMAVVELEAKHLSGQNDTDLYSFAEASGGVATMDTIIPLPNQ